MHVPTATNRGYWTSGAAGVIASCELPQWGRNQTGLLEEQLVLLKAEPSLRPPFLLLDCGYKVTSGLKLLDCGFPIRSQSKPSLPQVMMSEYLITATGRELRWRNSCIALLPRRPPLLSWCLKDFMGSLTLCDGGLSVHTPKLVRCSQEGSSELLKLNKNINK